MNRTLACASVIAALAAGLIAAAPAMAGTLTVDQANASSVYRAGAGENNNFSVTALGPLYVIQDRGVDEVPLSELGGSICTVMEPWKFKCPNTAIAAMTVELGDGSDTLDDTWSSLPTVVEAGPGPKTISTGGGNDRIFVRNSGADRISCGGGDDTVVADPEDAVAADCEHVDTSAGTGSAGSDDATAGTVGSTGAGGSNDGGGSANGANVFHTPFGLTLPNRPVTVPRPDVVVVHLACEATAFEGCRGDIVLAIPGRSRSAATRAKVVAARGHYVAQQRRGRLQRIGGRKFRLAAGESAALPVRVMYRGHFMAVQRQRRRGKRAVLKIAERDASGKVLDVHTRVVTLKLSNKWSRRHK